MRQRQSLLCLGLIIWLSSAGNIPASQAQRQFNVDLDTSPLMSASDGPFSVDFMLLDGSGTGDANNTATLGSFRFGTGGSPEGSATALGGATGDLSSTITLTDSSFINELTQPFTPGNTFHFSLGLTSNQDMRSISADQFVFSLLDGTGAALPTFGPGNALLVVDLETGAVQTFSTSGSSPVALSAPTVTITSAVTDTPEPTSLALMLSGGIGWVLKRRRRQR